MDHLLRRANTRTRLLVSLVILILASGLILACGESSANTGTPANSGTSSSSGNTPSTTKHYKVGDQVNVGSTWMVTVNGIKTSQGDLISQPKSGNTFLVVDVSLKNISSQEQNLSSLIQFILQDSTGQKYSETVLSSATPPDGKVEAGSPVRGQMVYEVPASIHQFTLAFQADILSDGQTIWDLSI